MSRRTKHIIAALFLLLLAIPVVYVALSWDPQEPWRARLVEVQELQGGEKKKVVIDVENISTVPLFIYIATVDGPGAPPDTSFPLVLEPLGPTTPCPLDFGFGYCVHVPPRAVRRFHVSVSVADLETVPASERAAGLAWASGTKHRALTGLMWLQRKLPSSWEDYLPFPSPGESDLPLDAGECASRHMTRHQ